MLNQRRSSSKNNNNCNFFNNKNFKVTIVYRKTTLGGENCKFYRIHCASNKRCRRMLFFVKRRLSSPHSTTSHVN